MLLQDIESVRPLTGAARSGCWTPVEVVVRGPYQGEVVVRTDVGFRFIREVSVPQGATARVVVPVVVLMMDARVTASLGAEGRRIALDPPLAFADVSDLIVGDVGGRAAREAIGEGRTAYVFPFQPADWTDPAMAESLDVVLGDPKTAALELFRLHGGRVLPAGAPLKGLAGGTPRFESVDPLAGAMLETDPWIASKREKASLVLALYFFVLLCGLAWLGSRKAALWMLFALIGATSAIFAGIQAVVPRGHSAAMSWEAEAGEATVRLVWLRSSKPGRIDAVFPRLAKPAFASPMEARRAEFDLVVGEVTKVRGAPAPQAFLVTEARLTPLPVTVEPGPWVGITNESPSRLAVHAVVGGLNGFVGEMASKDRKTARLTVDEPAPKAADFQFFSKRLLRGDCVFGWYAEPDRVYGGVDGADFAERRARPRFFVVGIAAKGGN